MKLLKYIYEKYYGRPAPYYYSYSMGIIVMKPIRKWLTNSIASSCPFNNVRIFLYRICGFDIGKHTFIGMHCYLDDMCYDLMHIGDHVTISYGVYFACHGRNQKHNEIVVKDGAYIGMRASVIGKNRENGKGIIIGENAIIGACSLVNVDIPAGKTAVGVPVKIL